MSIRSWALGTALAGLSSHAFATTWYVSSGQGRDSWPGTAAKPFATLQQAESVTRAGDTVLAMTGTYTNTGAGSNVLYVTRGGTSSAWITYAAAPGQHPVVKFTNSWGAINILANYVAIEGFEIIGNADSVTYAYGQSQARNLGNAVTNGDGIDVSSTGSTVTNHVLITGNVIHEIPGNGVEVQGADYITVSANTIYDTSWWSPYGDSGISLYELRDSDSSTAYKNFVVGNVTYNNSEYFPCACVGYAYVTDGNGIIIDDNKNTQSTNIAYNGRTLVAMNVSYDNGGSGIHAYSSQHVDIVDNTAYGNNATATINEGQIFSNSGADVNITNNVSVAPSGKVVISNNANASSVVESYNLFWGVNGAPTAPSSLGAQDLVANPLFASASQAKFQLDAGSPAINSGAAIVLSGTLPAGMTTQAMAAHRDRGAY